MRSASRPEAPPVRRGYAAVALLAAAWLACSDGAGVGLGVTGPASGGLVFIREEGGNADLMRARLSDHSVVRVNHTPGREERWPYWSSVAELVVFQTRSYRGSLMTDLRLWDPTTGEERPLTRTPQRDERWPTWSPAAPELAYVFKYARGRSGIALFDAESRRTRVVARTGPRDAFRRPAFAPDGRSFVAERRTPADLTRLWLLEPGQPPRNLTREPDSTDGKAVFAPDGASLVFTRRPGQKGPGDLARLDLATGEVTVFASLPEADDHSGKLSPARDELVFASDRDGSYDIFLAEPAGGVPRNLTRTPDLHEGAPIWSPDGERIAILRWATEASRTDVSPGEVRPDPTRAQIVVIDRSGRVLFETPGTMADWMPAWP
jgi:Tol biopolymer transport system component